MTIEVRSGYIPRSKRLIENPTAEQLRALTARMPNARRTIYDNYNVHTKVDSRSTKSTYIVTDPAFLTPARLIIEARNANIAGMQRHLYYAPAPGQQPEVTMIYTPNLSAPGYPNDRAIFVDLDAGITRVFNSDYFGESKKGGLSMWKKKVKEE